jgi:hypothetical protein
LTLAKYTGKKEMTLTTTIDTGNKIPAFKTHKALLLIADISGFTAYNAFVRTAGT